MNTVKRLKRVLFCLRGLSDSMPINTCGYSIVYQNVLLLGDTYENKKKSRNCSSCDLSLSYVYLRVKTTVQVRWARSVSQSAQYFAIPASAEMNYYFFSVHAVQVMVRGTLKPSILRGKHRAKTLPKNGSFRESKSKKRHKNTFWPN